MLYNQTQSLDVIIIGGGAAGIMAALSVKKHHPEYSVLILDRTFELGRKLVISGAGRGNLTNVNLTKRITDYYHGDETLLSTIFSQFGYADMQNFFIDLGVPLYEETKTERGKVFPVIDNAKTVRAILYRELEKKSIQVRCNTPVNHIIYSDTMWNIQTNSEKFSAKYCILAAGGSTYPSLGSDGSGYTLTREIGHTIIPPVPSAVPLVSKNQLSHYLQGEKMVMHVTSIIEGKIISMAVGDVLFTQYGFSGSAILDVSREISIYINRQGGHDVKIQLFFFPYKTVMDVEKLILNRFESHPNDTVTQSLWGLLTEKAANAVCILAKIPKDLKVNELQSSQITQLLQVLCEYEAPISATRSWNEAEFTAGGVDTSEVNPNTLESRKIPHLYFAGEILDVDGMIGGYNLSWAWASGWVAGKLQ